MNKQQIAIVLASTLAAAMIIMVMEERPIAFAEKTHTTAGRLVNPPFLTHAPTGLNAPPSLNPPFT
jgi:hypothetical protein